MRRIHLAQLDKTRPALILTRESYLAGRSKITVAPITSRARGLVTEVPVGPANGLDQACVVSCDNIETIDVTQVGRFLGVLHHAQEAALAEALVRAFDLQVEELP